MKSDPHANVIGYWPILVCALAAVAIPFLFAPAGFTPTERVSIGPDILIIHREQPEESLSRIAAASTAEVAQGDAAKIESPPEAPTPDKSGSVAETSVEPASPSDLFIRTADWRYVGGIVSPGKSVARVQRMESPSRIHLVKEGGRLEGVAVVEIAPATVLVSLGEDAQVLPLEQGPAFNPDEVFIPEEVADDPEVLASVVFAQTLGKYIAGRPDFSFADVMEDSTGESTFRDLDALSRAGALIPPQPGETPEEWAEAAAEGLAAEGQSDLDPSQHPLSEEDRLTLLGVHLLGRE